MISGTNVNVYQHGNFSKSLHIMTGKKTLQDYHQEYFDGFQDNGGFHEICIFHHRRKILEQTDNVNETFFLQK